MDRQHRAGRLAHHGFRNASEKNVRKPLAAVSTHDDEMDVVLVRVVEDLVGGCSDTGLAHWCQLALVSATQERLELVVRFADRRHERLGRRLGNRRRQLEYVKKV